MVDEFRFEATEILKKLEVDVQIPKKFTSQKEVTDIARAALNEVEKITGKNYAPVFHFYVHAIVLIYQGLDITKASESLEKIEFCCSLINSKYVSSSITAMLKELQEAIRRKEYEGVLRLLSQLCKLLQLEESWI